ncbi:MAG: 50S ribosomal protein L10 [Anaerolinea sp.]|nr:50S ribosomal protein L10 [Anaerolinea sp.]
MAINRERKEELVATYSELLGKTDGFIVAEYRKMSVARVNDLRKRLSDAAGGTYSVTKNTLFRIALEQNGWPVPHDILVGQSGVIFGNGNLPAVAKALQAYTKEKDNGEFLMVKGGVISGSIFRAEEIESVANLPTLDEIHAQLAGLIVQPASLLAGLLESATSQVVNVLQAYLQENESGDAAA